MYKEKLKSQLELLEEQQQQAKKYCGFIESVELSKQILSITKEIEEIEKAEGRTINVTIDGKEIYNSVCNLNDNFKRHHSRGF